MSGRESTRDEHAVARRAVDGHEACVWKVTGPGSVKGFTAMCFCGWEAEGHGREDGHGRERAEAERDAHLSEVSP